MKFWNLKHDEKTKTMFEILILSLIEERGGGYADSIKKTDL